MFVAESDIAASTVVPPPAYGMVPNGDKSMAERTLLDRVLDRLGVEHAARLALHDRTRRHGSTLFEEIVATHRISPRDLAEAMGAILDLAVEDPAAPVAIAKDARGLPRCGQLHLVGTTAACETRIFIAPELERLADIARALPLAAAERDRVRITTPQAIAHARASDTCRQRSDAARLSLAADLNRWSAREVMTAFQGSLLTLLMTGLLVASLLLGRDAWFWLHLLCTFVAFVCTMFRLVVLLTHRRQTPASRSSSEAFDAGLPFYSVLVALHDEAEIAADTVRAMAALDWPASRLEVLFVCEATDPATIDAVDRAIAAHPHFTLVVTPATKPTTKPKALNFALPLTRGEFVVLYDAEDRPDPGQLREAWSRFAEAEDELACLQAPLVVTNGATGWRQAHFAMEYAVLFRMLLPWLARSGLPLPLGGTSNHFRRDHLVSAGGWDSHNVAEDADLGIRLARLGFTTSVLTRPTFETSTTRWRDWRNQRTRWMKGWIQTWLVHMRDPAVVTRQLGWKGLLAFQIVFTGMIASALAHLVLIAHLAFAVASWRVDGMLPSGHGWLAAIDAANLLVAYLVFSLSFMRIALPDERGLRRHLVSLWGYWAIVSYAALRAAWQLGTAPHLWEKTPHPRSATAASAELVYEP